MSQTIFNLKSGLPMISGGGQWRMLAALPSPKLVALPNFGEVHELIPRSDWKECTLREWGVTIRDQGAHGSCTGQATQSALAYAWKISGQKFHEFSPTYIYAQVNGGQDRGAQVSNAVMAAQKGTCLFEQCGQNTIYMNQISAEAKKTASRFKVLEVYRVKNFDELGTAMMRGYPVVSGIAVGDNFGNLSSDGVAQLPDRIAGGHALCHIGMKNVNGKWVIDTQNSWGVRWGLDGFCFLQEGAWNQRYGFGFDAWAITAVADDPEETETDPPLLKEESHDSAAEG